MKFLTRKINSTFYWKWINEIIKKENAYDIENHIIKHVQELVDSKRNKESWSASMRNLLDIYDRKYNLKIDHSLQIQKLHNHYLNNPTKRIPPPGGRIPKYVNIRKVSKFDD